MLSDRRIYLTVDGHPVDESDPAAHSLLVGKGCVIKDSDVAKYGLTFETQPEPPKPLTEKDLVTLRGALEAREEGLEAREEALKTSLEALAKDLEALDAARNEVEAAKAALAIEAGEIRKEKETLAVSKQQAASQTRADDQTAGAAGAAVPAEAKAVQAPPETKAVSGPAESK